MARKNTEETTTTELSPEAQAARDAVRNVPRQSQVRFVQHYLTVRDAEPDRVDEFFAGQVEAIEAFIEEHGEHVDNPIEKAVAAATAKQVEQSIKALTNEDPLNGYVGFVFDPEVAAKKVTPTTPRAKKSKVEKIQDILAGGISEDDQATLAELLKAAGLA